MRLLQPLLPFKEKGITCYSSNIDNKEIKDNVVYLQVEEISLEEGGDLEDIHELPDSGSLISEHKLLKSRIKKVMRGG